MRKTAQLLIKNCAERWLLMLFCFGLVVQNATYSSLDKRKRLLGGLPLGNEFWDNLGELVFDAADLFTVGNGLQDVGVV